MINIHNSLLINIVNCGTNRCKPKCPTERMAQKHRIWNFFLILIKLVECNSLCKYNFVECKQGKKKNPSSVKKNTSHPARAAVFIGFQRFSSSGRRLDGLLKSSIRRLSAISRQISCSTRGMSAARGRQYCRRIAAARISPCCAISRSRKASVSMSSFVMAARKTARFFRDVDGRPTAALLPG